VGNKNHSQAIGKSFEDIFKKSCLLSAVACTRIPDGCRDLGHTLIRVKTPWDFVLTCESKTALIDTKTTYSGSFPHSLLKEKEHQVQALYAHERAGAIAGYVIWFRSAHKVAFFPAFALMDALDKRGSFTPDHPFAVPMGSDMFDVRTIFTGRVS
jgi:hypothetical protein